MIMLSRGASAAFFVLLLSPAVQAQDNTCSSTADCPAEEYCAERKGVCLPMMDCVFYSDCFNPDNQYMSETACEGQTTLVCESGMPNSFCTRGCLDIRSCETTDDCFPDDYCASTGECLGPRFCKDDSDCFREDNVFYENSCVGTTTCEPRTGVGFSVCTKTCDEIQPPTPSPTTLEPTLEWTPAPTSSGGSCSSTADCPADRYCRYGECALIGDCSSDRDCLNPENQWMTESSCEGQQFIDCEDGTFCSRSCLDYFRPCETTDDCFRKEYCAMSTGECLDWNQCKDDSDCFQEDNENGLGWGCVGTTTCELREPQGFSVCTKTCDEEVEEEAEENDDTVDEEEEEEQEENDKSSAGYSLSLLGTAAVALVATTAMAYIEMY